MQPKVTAPPPAGRYDNNLLTNTIPPQVMQSLRFALQPAVVDVSVTWDLPEGVSATVLSPPITAIFQGQRSLIYAQLTGQVGGSASGLVLGL